MMYRGKNTRSTIYNYVTRKESVASSRSKDGKPASTGGTDFSHNRYPLTVNYKLSIREIITLHYTLDLPTFIHGRKNKFSGSFNIAMVLRVNLNAVNYL